MDELITALYQSFYQPIRDLSAEREIERCHAVLAEKLDSTEAKLVLKIVDEKDHIADMMSFDSFFAGFQMAWTLSRELEIRGKSNPLVPTDL